MVCSILLTENYPKDIIYESMNYKGKRMEIDKIQMYERELEIIDNMNGHEFEKFCAKLLENCEFRDVKVTKGSGDFGIDITARYHNRIYGIQCKRYSKSINLKAVQEVSSGAEFYQCDIAVVMCNGTFTKSAISLAEQIGVRLWGRKELVDWLDECENLDFIEEFIKDNIENEVEQIKKETTYLKKDTPILQNTKNLNWTNEDEKYYRQAKIEYLCVFFGGWFGIHKFYQKKIGMGILYMFTFGVFGVGWLIDGIKIALKLQKYTDKKKGKIK